MPFRLWPAQVGLAWTLMSTRLVVILKARQLGISWLCCAYALWHCLFQPGKTALLYSQGQDEANELLRRIKFLYQSVPDWLRPSIPAVTQDNTTLVEWSNGSRIRSLPATQKAGRSHTASLVVMDEAAFLQWGQQLYTALKPTIDGGGQLIVLSTANGVGGLFHTLWTKAVEGLNGFTTVFLPWWSRPGRDRAWYEARVREESDPQRVKQEYPESAGEAFLVSGRPRFHPDWIAAQAEHARDGGLPEWTLPESLRGIPGLTVYELPAPGRKYVIGADVAEGLEHGDASDAAVMDAESWAEVATIHVRQEPDEFARSLAAVSDVYDAAIAPERNNHGHAVIATLKLIGCHRVADGYDDRPGWLTNVQTKPLIIDLLATALRDGLIKIRTRAALDEMSVYQVEADGRTNAPEGMHDDRVMSRAIALGVARRPIQSYSLGEFTPAPRLPRTPPGSGATPRDDWHRREQTPQPAGPEAAAARAIPVIDRPRRRNFYGR